MKILVYTAITNNHDELKSQNYIASIEKEQNVEYRAYLDKETYMTAYHSTTDEGIVFWEDCRYSHDNFKDPKKNCQIHKILSHLYSQDFDCTVWIDGSIILKSPIEVLIEDNMDSKADIALLRHSERDCVYEEAWDCTHFKLDDEKIIDSQMQFYKNIGFPEHYGLSETPVIIRRNTKAVITFNNMWWAIISRYSKRDQLSFDFARWTLAMPINHIKGNIHNNDYFEIAKHKVLREHEK